jgi:L-amino acid N-acyltransferase YncA
MLIRAATEADIPEMQAIYAHHVLHGTGTFEEIPPTIEEMEARWRNVINKGCSWLVAQADEGVAGYGYYQQIRDRSAYRFTAEDSIYVRENVRGQGVGKALVVALVQARPKPAFAR